MKAQRKTESSVERYRRIRAERAAKDKIHEFTSPSGMVWKLRRPNLSQYVMNGVMPMGMTGKLAAQVSEGADPATLFTSLTWDEQVKTIEFANKIVRYCAVEPKIVESPTEPDEIGYDEVELDDYNAIVAWAMEGGDEAANLETFRRK